MNSKDIHYLIENGLENDRVRLSVITDVEQVTVLKDIILIDPMLMEYSPTNILNESDFIGYFKNAVQLLKENKAVPFLIYDKQNKAYAGSSRYANISVKDQRVEIGWTWLGLNFQRTGLNRNNKFLMLSYAFEKVGCERVELKADAANVKSRKAMEGIGARYEGALRSHTLMSDGRRRDTVYYSILKREWSELKTTIFKNFKS